MSKWTARTDYTALLTPAAVVRWSIVFVEMQRLSLYFYLGRSIELTQSDKDVHKGANINSSWVTSKIIIYQSRMLGQDRTSFGLEMLIISSSLLS